MGKWILAIFVALIASYLIFCPKAKAQDGTNKPVYAIFHDIAAGNIATNAYTQLDAALDASCSDLLVSSTTNNPLYLAVGAASAEINIPYYIGTGVNQSIHVGLKKGVRLAVRALGTAASSGYLLVNCLQ